MKALATTPVFKRFYQRVSVSAVGQAFGVNLDDLAVQTPHGRQLLVPSEALAIAIATEFEMQRDEINYYTMPLFKFSAAGSELTAEGLRQHVIKRISGYLETDAICYRDEYAAVRRKQEQYFNPIMEHLKTRYSIDLHEVFGSV